MVTLKEIPPNPAVIKRRLATLCRREHIARLEVFGSVARGEAIAGSDVDLIATFSVPVDMLRMIGLEQEMGAILRAPVNLLTSGHVAGLRNPFVKKSIEADRKVIFSSENAR